MLLFIANLFGQYLTKPSKDHHINLKSSVRDYKIGRFFPSPLDSKVQLVQHQLIWGMDYLFF